MSDRLRLLKSLGHWVGDMHQPLHVAFDDDRRKPRRYRGQCRSNRHAVRDAFIIEKKIGLGYALIAAKLPAEKASADFVLFETILTLASNEISILLSKYSNSNI